MVEEDGEIPIIIDNGSGYIKAGVGGEGGPRSVFPSIIGHYKFQEYIGGGKDYFVGAEAEEKRGMLDLNYPIDRGEIKDWYYMETIWDHIFTNALKIDPEKHKVLITEVSKNQKENREKIAQVMFETFNIPGLYIANPALLSLCSYGKFTGVVVDLGYGTSQIVPIYDGVVYPTAVVRQLLAGRDLTEYMAKILKEKGYNFYNASRGISRDIKEKSCYVSLNYEEEIKSVEKFDYELPDGTHIFPKETRIKCPEILFKPNILGNELGICNIGQACYNSIQKFDNDIRKDFYNNILLSGGTSMFKGLKERLEKEIKDLVPQSMKEEIKVIASDERKFLAWIGGSILSSLSTFESFWIPKEEYEEEGARIVDKYCKENLNS